MKKYLQAKATELFEFFDGKDNGYQTHQMTSRLFEVNVKIHKRLDGLDDVIEDYPKKYRERITDEFTEERVNNLYEQYIDWEGRQAIDVINTHGSLTAMTAESWQKYAGDALDHNKPTGYPAIDKLKTEEEKRKQLKKFIEADRLTLAAFNAVNPETAGLYGRMGGHFCFDITENPAEDLQSLIDWVPDNSDDQSITISEAQDVIKNAEQLKGYVLYIKNWIKQGAAGIPAGWHDELKFRIDEYIEELKDEEKRAKDPDYTRQTLGQFLTSKDQTIKRHALGILKALTK